MELRHGPQERPHYCLKAIRLVVRKPVAGVSDLFHPKVWVPILQFSCRLQGNNGAVVPNDEQAWDANRAHQLLIFRVWRPKNVKRTDSSLQPRLSQQFEE